MKSNHEKVFYVIISVFAIGAFTIVAIWCGNSALITMETILTSWNAGIGLGMNCICNSVCDKLSPIIQQDQIKFLPFSAQHFISVCRTSYNFFDKLK